MLAFAIRNAQRTQDALIVERFDTFTASRTTCRAHESGDAGDDSDWCGWNVQNGPSSSGSVLARRKALRGRCDCAPFHS